MIVSPGSARFTAPWMSPPFGTVIVSSPRFPAIAGPTNRTEAISAAATDTPNSLAERTIRTSPFGRFGSALSSHAPSANAKAVATGSTASLRLPDLGRPSDAGEARLEDGSVDAEIERSVPSPAAVFGDRREGREV